MQTGQQLGPFIIDKPLGSGAMGAVYRARYIKTGVTVALKVIALGLSDNEGSLARFEREMAILKQLRHPNIVRFYGGGRSQGTPFYAMEYIEGESLDHVIGRRGRLTWEEVVALGQQLCAALQHAHEKGIIHRDLKPSNLMILPDGTLKLTDFGIAKDTDVTALTGANCAVGTASYMSPEQCRGERDLTFKSDLYSLGIVFYELMTGRKPFLAQTPMDMFMLHLQGTFERPSRLVLDIPIWLDTLVCQLLEKKPEHRPRDAEMVAQSLNRVAEKVAAQQSAGVDAVRTQTHQRQRAAVTDETDREAARTLRQAAGRKGKRVVKPFYEKVWFRAAGLSALLLAVLITLGFFLRGMIFPGAEPLYQEAEKHLKSKDPNSWAEAEEPLNTLLVRYPHDPHIRQVKAWRDNLLMSQEEWSLHNRIEGKLNSDPKDKSEELAFGAVHAEKDGDLERARAQWQALANDQDSRRGLSLLAEQVRLPALDRAAGMLKHVEDEEGPFRSGQYQSQSDLEGLALEAKRYEEFGDLAAASGRWHTLKDRDETRRPPRLPPDPAPEDVKQQYQQGLDQWEWNLIAAQEIRRLAQHLPDNPDAQRQKLVEAKLAEVKKLKDKDPVNARLLCQDILALYPKDAYPDLDKQVEEARNLMPPPPGQ